MHCRDPRSDELTVAVGETGWFPSGTLCDLLKPSYCLSGKCVVSTFLKVFTLVRYTLTLTVVKHKMKYNASSLTNRNLMKKEYQNKFEMVQPHT